MHINHRGFSLVELSIVLVILGLLTGGILAGQSLIRASELRSVSNDLQRYQAAIHTFRDKYFGIPGDFNKGFDFWGANCGTNNPVMTVAGGCNGDGDGIFEPVTVGGGESSLGWRHLALAGLIEGNYDGNFNRNDIVAGRDVPGLKLNQGILRLGWTNGAVGEAALWNGMMRNKNLIYIGTYYTNEWNSGAYIKPEDMWNIDTKMDDGKPGYGIITGTAAYDGSAYLAGCTTGAWPATLTYDLAATGNTCKTLFALEGAFGPTM